MFCGIHVESDETRSYVRLSQAGAYKSAHLPGTGNNTAESFQINNGITFCGGDIERSSVKHDVHRKKGVIYLKDEQFKELKSVGENGARIVMKNISLFLGRDVIWIKDVQRWKIEGTDFIALIANWHQAETKKYDETLKDAPEQQGKPDEDLKLELLKGGIEAKTIRPGKSLQRNDIGESSCITIPFAIWDGIAYNERGNIWYTRETFGWLRRMIEPTWKRLSSEPLGLVFILECLDKDGKSRPFASIAFNDFERLKDRLIIYGRKNGLDLEDWNSIPVGKAAEDFKCGDLIFRGNMWHVPLNELLDLARIVTIGDAPSFSRNRSCTPEMQRVRYQHLRDSAVAHVFFDEVKVEENAMPQLSNHPIFELMRLEAEERFKEELVNGEADIEII